MITTCPICGVTLRKGEVKYCRACSHSIDMEKERREKNQRQDRSVDKIEPVYVPVIPMYEREG